MGLHNTVPSNSSIDWLKERGSPQILSMASNSGECILGGTHSLLVGGNEK